MPRRIVHFKCRVFVMSAVRNHYHNSKECLHQGLVGRVPNDWTKEEESLMSEVLNLPAEDNPTKSLSCDCG